MIRSEQQAREDLGDLEPDLHRIVYEALCEYLDDHSAMRFKYSQRTEANIVHDYMARSARRVLGDSRRARIIHRNGEAFLLCLDGRYALKLKKLSDELKGSNIPTHTALRFINQNGQQLIPDASVLDPTSLILGYQRRELNLLESPIYLVCPDGDNVAWDWLLEPADDSFMPVPTDTPTPVPTGRVRPRTEDQPEPLEDDVADEDQGTRSR